MYVNKKYVFYSLIPIAINIMLDIPFYIFGSSYSSNVFVLLTKLIVNIGTPFYLSILNYRQLTKKAMSYIIVTLFVFGVFTLFVYVSQFVPWAARGINLYSLDAVSIGLTKLAIKVELSFLLVSWIGCCIFRLILK